MRYGGKNIVTFSLFDIHVTLGKIATKTCNFAIFIIDMQHWVPGYRGLGSR